MAVGAICAIQAAGLTVGPDIGVSGFDASPYTEYLNPPLTTVAQPAWEVGQLMVEMLMTGLIDNKLPAFTGTLLSPKLIIRQSSLRQPEKIILYSQTT